jgi:hypothetical protein
MIREFNKKKRTPEFTGWVNKEEIIRKMKEIGSGFVQGQ